MSYASEALRAAILKTLADAVGSELAEIKEVLREAMGESGVEKITARLPDGTKVASLALAGGEAGPKVTDPHAFQDWVKANHPHQLTEVVRDSYTKAVLDEVKKAGRAVDRKTGETIPGITFEPTTPYVKVDFTRGDVGGRDLIRRAHQRGDLNMLNTALALPAGDGDAG